MPIDKLTPRQLDSDADNKTISKASMLDALNLYSGPDNDSLTIVEGKLTKSDAGNGILKNIKGNEKVEGALLEGSRVIGGVEDKKTRITYIFVYHPNASKQGVFAYDSEGLLPDSTGPTLRKIYTSSQFNFPQNGFVKADIVYSAAVRTFEDLGEDFEKDAIIYFTDGVNEPRKINAYRAFEFGSSIHGNDEFAEADFITACPKTQLDPITFVFDSDPDATSEDSRSVNNFEKSPGFQFAYQHVYIDGMESAISSYSDLAVLPSVVDQGAQSYVEHLNYRCLLTIPAAGPEIEKIRILGKQGNTGSFLIIDEIEPSEEPQEYAFFNDRVLKGVSTDEVNKQFDSLPRNAKSQSVTSNRLMYGNYLDGFDKSGTTATATVIYLDRPEDFIDFDINDIPSIDLGFLPHENTDVIGESAGFFLDYSGLPDFMPAGTQVNVNFSFKPQKNFHYYRAGTAGQTRQRGPQPSSTDDEIFSGVNFEQSYAVSSEDNGSENFPSSSSNELPPQDINAAQALIWGLPLDQIFDEFGSGNNSGAGNFTTWVRKDTPLVNGVIPEGFDFPEEVTEATFGTSAAAPFIFEGQSISFSASFNFTVDVTNAQNLIKETVEACFTQSSPLSPAGVEILSSNNESSYNIDLGLSSGSVITQNYVGQDAGYDVNCSRIVAVANLTGTTISGVPCGFFIVNKATPTFRLQKNLNPGQSGVDYPDNATRSHFTFRLTGFDCNPYSDVLTCIHDTATTALPNSSKNEWVCISAADLDALFNNSYGGSGIFDWIANKLGQSVEESFHGFGNAPVGGIASVPTINSTQGYGQQIGRILKNPGEAFIQTSVAGLGGVGGGIGGVSGGVVSTIFASSHSLMDGEGGPGGGPARAFASAHPYDALRMNKQGSVTVNPFVAPGSDQVHFYHSTVFYGGYLSPLPLATNSNFGEVTILPFLKNTSTNSLGRFEYQIPEGDEEFGALNADSVNFKRNQSILEQQTLNPVTILNSDGLGFGRESFKTEANHDFGIVYYDERGRHGFVDHLATAFVEGYTITERGGENTGAVDIELVLQGTPPDWAHTYKIVYAKNSSVQDFVQYSVGGAFVGGDPNDDEVSEANKNIYVSLNYLQGHPVSYVSSFGARTPEGGLNFYKFERGDKLKVISHGSAEGRVFHSYEFDVVDLVDLGPGDENPLSNDPSSNQVGQFVVLKDSPNANGFNHNSVAFGSDSGGNKWNENCIVELRTPKKTQEVDEQIYYEASPSYKVVKQPSGELTHSVGATASDPIILTKGDVWFRRVATNVKPFQNGEFIDIIPDDDGADPSPQPNFTTVYMETPSFSDLFRSDSLSIGRPNVIFEDASETIRENTITYSDPSNPESTKLRYSSFNASLANFKDLSETFGGIQYMSDHGDFVVVIQRDNVSLVPVGKNILSDASGNQQLIASRNVLNEAVVYPGRSGCDIDPSSVFDSGTEVFFANKNLGEVYRWSKNTGPQVISDIGVSSVLRAIFKKAVELNLNTVSPNESRIVGGWDPFKKEYLLSVVDVETKSTTGVAFADQPNADVVAPDGAGGDGGNGDDGGDTNAPSGLTVFPTDIEFGELEVNKPETSVVNIVNNDPDFISITSITSNNPTYDVGNMVFPIMLFGAGSGISNEFNLTVNALALEEGDQNGTLEITTDNELQIRILLPITGSAVIAEPPVEDLLPFTVAYNEYYNESKKDEDMSTEIAKQYIIDRTNDASDPLKINDLQELMGSGYANPESLNDMLIRQARVDLDFNGNVGVPDLLDYLAVHTTNYDSSLSILSPPDPLASAKSTENQPKPKPTTQFKNPADAVTYLIAQGAMTVGEYLQLRSFLRQDVTLNLNQQGNIAALDLIEFLQVYGMVTENSEPAFLPSNQGGIPVGVTAQETINWLIDDGTMTISQYFNLAQYVRVECKADSNQDNSLTTADLLNFIALFGGPQFGEEGYGPNDPAFAF